MADLKSVRRGIHEIKHKFYKNIDNDPNIAGFYKNMLDLCDEDVNKKNDYGRTLLMYAAINKDTYMIRYLLRKGASIDILDNEGNDVFYYTWNKYIRQRIKRATIMKLWDNYTDSYDYRDHIMQHLTINNCE